MQTPPRRRGSECLVRACATRSFQAVGIRLIPHRYCIRPHPVGIQHRAPDISRPLSPGTTGAPDRISADAHQDRYFSRCPLPGDFVSVVRVDCRSSMFRPITIIGTLGRRGLSSISPNRSNTLLAVIREGRLDTVETYLHDGGLFSFSVPAHWSHQTEDDGTQVFWDENAGSGTLRVTSLTASREADPNSIPQLDLLSKEVPPSIRDDGVAWVKYRREDTENGEPVIMFWWEFAHFVAPRYARIAFFSFTIYADEEQQIATHGQLEALDRLSSVVKFSGLQAFEQ
jgi:hypothetical protein